jgi:hypothetical protein
MEVGTFENNGHLNEQQCLLGMSQWTQIGKESFDFNVPMESLKLSTFIDLCSVCWWHSFETTTNSQNYFQDQSYSHSQSIIIISFVIQIQLTFIFTKISFKIPTLTYYYTSERVNVTKILLKIRNIPSNNSGERERRKNTEKFLWHLFRCEKLLVKDMYNQRNIKERKLYFKHHARLSPISQASINNKYLAFFLSTQK